MFNIVIKYSTETIAIMDLCDKNGFSYRRNIRMVFENYKCYCFAKYVFLFWIYLGKYN